MSNIYHFKLERSCLISGLIQEKLKLSLEEISTLFSLGGIYLNENRIHIDQILDAGSYLRVHAKPKRFPVPQNVFDLIHFQNEDFIVANKPSELPTHPTLDNTQENLLTLLEKSLQLKLYPCHRLDVATQGLLVIAKTKKFENTFQAYLRDNLVEKKYWAHIHGHCHPKKYIHFMKKSARAPKQIFAEEKDDHLKCELEVLSVNPQLFTSQIQIRLITGRTHQIRAQLSYMGCPIIGDTMYGSTVHYGREHIWLKCVELQFPNLNLTQKPWQFSLGVVSLF